MSSFFHQVFLPQYLGYMVLFLLGTMELMVLFAVNLYRKNILQNGEETTGKVIDLVSRRRPKRGTVFYPVFQYKTFQNEEVTRRSNMGSKFPPYKVGDDVVIVYNPAKPSQFILPNDVRFRKIYFIIGGIALAIAVFGLIGLLPVLKS